MKRNGAKMPMTKGRAGRILLSRLYTWDQVSQRHRRRKEVGSEPREAKTP